MVRTFHGSGRVYGVGGHHHVRVDTLTNDTALLTFLPLGWFVLSSTGQEKHTALCSFCKTVPPTSAE